VKTLPDLIAQLNHWRAEREVYHYFNSVNSPTYLFIDILGDVFQEDFEKAVDLMPAHTQHQQQTREYLKGIALQSANAQPNIGETRKLRTFLDEMDRRRHTDWRKVYPWLEPIFEEILNG
jgi:hypothetical protein